MEEQNLNAEQVAAFLRTNPDFLSRHGDVFASLEVPHPHGGQAITLAERHTPRLKKIWECRCGSRKCTGTMLQPKR